MSVIRKTVAGVHWSDTGKGCAGNTAAGVAGCTGDTGTGVGSNQVTVAGFTGVLQYNSQ